MMEEDKEQKLALRKAAQDSIRANSHKLSISLQADQAAVFPAIVAKFAGQQVLKSENAYLDAGQSSADRADLLVSELQRRVSSVPNALDDILCILHESGSPVVQEAAKTIAKDYGSTLSKYDGLTGFQKEYSKTRARKKSALNKWMKEGYIDLKVTRVNMLGVPGSGKTCAQLLLLDEDAPTEGITDSTAIASPTVRAMRVAVDDESMKWKRITREKLLESLAADLIEASQEKIEDSGTDAVSSDGTDQSSSYVLKNSVSKNIGDTDFHAEKVVQEILAKDVTDIRLKGHWLYVIDSGGQPAYQELLPLFTRAASLNIITLDLSEPLDKKLHMMYRADGKYFNCHSKSTQLASFHSAVSTAGNFKSLSDARNLDAISCITKPHHHSMHLVLGTHYDKVDDADLRKCEDTLKSSISSLQPYLNDRIIKRSDNSIIFPVNTVAKSKEEKNKYRKQVCEAIWTSGVDATVEIKIPIRWFSFELSLPKESSIISFKEAASIGMKYGMNEKYTKQALQHFHDFSVMLYYPEVINVVFLDPKPILDILSHLLALTYVQVDDSTPNALQKSILLEPISQTLVNNLRDGFFYKEIFTSLKSNQKIFSHPEFQLCDLISLLLHLNIITKVDGNEKGSYFIPYALPSYHVSDNDSRPKVEVSDVQPLLIIWREENKCLPVPQGLFPLVVMHLLNQKELKIDLPSSSRPDFYFKFRDAMSIKIAFEEIPHTLHLINRYSHIKIAFTGPQEHCSKIRKVVMQAIDKVTDDLHMEHNHENAFACQNDLEKKCYRLIANKDEFKVNCTDCPKTAPITDDSSYKCWFKCSTTVPRNTNLVPPAPPLKNQKKVEMSPVSKRPQKKTKVSPSLKDQQVKTNEASKTLKNREKTDELSSSPEKKQDKWSKLGVICVVGLVLLGAFILSLVGYFAFLNSYHTLVGYGVVLFITIVILSEIFSIWKPILRITVFATFIAVIIGIFITMIVILIIGDDATKRYLIQTIVTAVITPVMNTVMNKLFGHSNNT